MANDKDTKNIVVLGGSVGGVGSAHYLLRHVVPDLPQYKVILISPNTHFLWRPACPRALVRDTFSNDKRLLVPISEILQQYPEDRYQLIQGTATSVDLGGRTLDIQLAGGGAQTMNFDALIVATGASTTSPLFGMNEDDVQLQQSWRAIHQALPAVKSIVIAGGGPAAVETAGELGEMLNGRKGWFGHWEAKVPITIITSGSQILPALRESLAQTAESYLADVGVEVVKGKKVTGVTPDGAGVRSDLLTTKAAVQLDDGTSLDTDLYIPATGLTANSSFMTKTFTTSDGRINVNPSSLRVLGTESCIYAVGDVSNYARPTVHGMFDAIPVMCANLKRDLLAANGQETLAASKEREFRPDTSETQFVPIGSSRGVGAVMGWRLPSWLVSWVKGRDYLLWGSSGITSGKQWAKA